MWEVGQGQGCHQGHLGSSVFTYMGLAALPNRTASRPKERHRAQRLQCGTLSSELDRMLLPPQMSYHLQALACILLFPGSIRNSKLSGLLCLTPLSNAPDLTLLVCHNYQHPHGKMLLLEVISHSDTAGS